MADAGVDLLRCSTNYRVWFHDGERFEHSSDLASMRREVERWEGPEGFERWLAWLREGHRHYDISVREVLRKNFNNFWDMARPSFVRCLLDMHPFESIWARSERYFHTERLRRVFTFATMYMGMSPFDAPATYSLLQYTEFAEGIWYPRGGFHKVVEALETIGRRDGVEFRMDSPVTKVLTTPDGKTATGVEVEGGETLEADIVIVNSDLVYSYTNLLPRATNAKIKTQSKSLTKRESSCSSISFYWSLDRMVPELSTHNIFLAEEYRESFDAIFKQHGLPIDPSFYVNVPSRIDPSAAPEGKDSVIVLVPIGHLQRSKTGDDDGLPDELPWGEIVDRAREAIISTIEARTGCTLRAAIKHEMVNTPLTWEEKFNLDRGSILGLSHNFFNVLWFRPKTRSPEVKGAYFVGASTHPGTGVPIVLAGAKITAEQILRDLGMPVPWGAAKDVVAKGKLGAMDVRSDPRLKFGTEEVVFMFLLLMGVIVLSRFVALLH